MCRLRNIALRDYQKCDYRTDRHTHSHTQTDARQSDPYVPLCFADDTIKLNPHEKFPIYGTTP